jgi:hypothetical protein
VGTRQALGWLGAAVCSVALVVAGGLVVSSYAVQRYLQSSSALMQHSGASDSAAPDARERTVVEDAVSHVITMPGVATASCHRSTDGPASPAPVVRTSAATPAATGGGWDISVIMTANATAAQAADAVYALMQDVATARINLELSSPAGEGHAASVVDYRDAFDAPVTRTTVESLSQAVATAAALDGVASVHVTVPYTWNLAEGDLEVTFDGDAQRHEDELERALSRTALSGVEWYTPR